MQKMIIEGADYHSIVDEGHYEVRLEKVTLDFYYRPSATKKAYVFFPGWINRSESPYPYFQRVSWFKQLDGVGISFADPTQRLSVDIQIGWFIGTYATDYTKITSEFVSGFLAHLGIEPPSTLFFGSSAGGFAALAFAAYCKGTKALAVNPQLDVLRFHDIIELDKMFRICFNKINMAGIESTIPWRVNIGALWGRLNYIPEARIYMNTYDHWHMRNHLPPILSAMDRKDVPDGFGLDFYSDREAGHTPPGHAVMIPVIQKLMA